MSRAARNALIALVASFLFSYATIREAGPDSIRETTVTRVLLFSSTASRASETRVMGAVPARTVRSYSDPVAVVLGGAAVLLGALALAGAVRLREARSVVASSGALIGGGYQALKGLGILTLLLWAVSAHGREEGAPPARVAPPPPREVVAGKLQEADGLAHLSLRVIDDQGCNEGAGWKNMMGMPDAATVGMNPAGDYELKLEDPSVEAFQKFRAWLAGFTWPKGHHLIYATLDSRKTRARTGWIGFCVRSSPVAAAADFVRQADRWAEGFTITAAARERIHALPKEVRRLLLTYDDTAVLAIIPMAVLAGDHPTVKLSTK